MNVQEARDRVLERLRPALAEFVQRKLDELRSPAGLARLRADMESDDRGRVLRAARLALALADLPAPEEERGDADT